MMTSKERMLIALNRGKPDRLPATIHQWQDYHLKHYMGGKTDLEAFKDVGLDAAITYTPFIFKSSDNWRESYKKYEKDGQIITDYTIETPEGVLTYKTGTNQYTTWMVEHLIKRDEDIYLLKKYRPVPGLDRDAVSKRYDEIGDDGILRMFINGIQGGCWQDACELYGTENMIMAVYDKPDWVHEFLQILLEQKLAFIYDNMKGIKVDLVETGGGAASSTVISPRIHAEFCLPYDKKIHDALHDIGHKVVYHTCGGMMAILDLIVQNGCDASETLSPPGVGGDITDPHYVKNTLGEKVALIGGFDQFNILTDGTPEDIRKEVHRLFEGFGQDGGYIMSASDHFFHAPRENLVAYARAAYECVY